MMSSVTLSLDTIDVAWPCPLDERLFRVVGAARERARDDLHEAFRVAERFEARELLGGDELLDVEMAFGRLQILSHGEDVYTDRARVVHRLFDLGLGLAQPEHQRRLGVGHLAGLLRMLEDAQRLAVV